MKPNIQGQTALVTGASSGLGVDFARNLARRGANLVLVARRADLLEAVKNEIHEKYKVQVHVIVQDLSTPTAALDLLESLKNKNIQVDILINNAGYGLYGKFDEIAWQKEHNMLELDIITVSHMTRVFSQEMRKRKYGYILNIASIGAFQPTPLYASYSAAKSYVLSFSEAVNFELRGSGVSVSTLSPGITATEFLKVSGQSPTIFQRLTLMKPDKVTEIGIRGMLWRCSHIIPGLVNQLAYVASKFLPKYLIIRTAYFTMK